LANVENQLGLTLRALWNTSAPLQAYATGLQGEIGLNGSPMPWSTHRPGEEGLEATGAICLPDVYDDFSAVPTGAPAISGLDRYRVALAHIAAPRPRPAPPAGPALTRPARPRP
jgi:hypothetical protein